MEKARRFASTAARVKVPVLILGETGTGKSLLGRVIHAESPRARGPYQAINCAGVPDTLFESEFFGYQRGAFTGARDGRRGVMEQAHRGSLFLDEVGELSLPQQAKLLTALEDGEIRRLGGEGTIRIDARILAASARPLPGDVQCGRFRRDLFHRLAVLSHRLSPLRSRREDIPLLSGNLLRMHERRHRRSSGGLSQECLSFLQAQEWPGNVRELSHVLEAALILAEDGPITTRILQAARVTGDGWDAGMGPVEGGGEAEGEEALSSKSRSMDQGRSRYAFSGTAEEERKMIRSVLERCRGNRSLAARELGMSRGTLRNRLRRYAME